MKVETQTKYSYRAIDGALFDSEGECRAYEDSLPAHLVFCLQQKHTAEQLRKVGYYQLGYSTSWTTTEYEAPGFLREGGEYQATHSSDMMLELCHGDLSDVVSYALKTGWARHNGKFIREAKVVDLMPADDVSREEAK